MAELRRVGGSLESHRAFASPRVLLPSEIQIIEALGLTEDEYWEFLRLNDEYNGKRSEAYAHIPDIKNDAVVTPILVNLVIGIALTAVGALLAPKPRSPEQKKAGSPLATEDQTSRSRYAPQSSFDSIQQLAVLGSVIPLVYTKQQTQSNVTYGGVRVNSSLLWSYMTTLGRAQQLRALMLFSHGTVPSPPDYAGYAIGDLLIENYALGKAKLFFATGEGKPGSPSDNRFLQSTAYGQYRQGEMQDLAGGSVRDPFAVEWGDDLQPFFSGSRTPTTQAAFGTYAPMPNGMRYKVPYELVLEISTTTQIQNANNQKIQKVAASFPRFPYIEGPDRGYLSGIPAGTTVTYRVPAVQHNTDSFQPWGSNDIRQATDNGRIDVDANLIVGETYMIGTGFGVCIKKENSPWIAGTSDMTAQFKLTTIADYSTFSNPTGDYGDGLAPAGGALLIQRAAVATVSNNRACDRTDLIIKSTVYRKINGFANVNSEPSNDLISEYQSNDSPITLGNMTLYNKRLSFFALQYRNIGETSWKTMTGDKYFCVLGQTPEAAYNMISIFHPTTKQFEYQLVPIAGNAIEKFKLNRPMYFLEAASSFDTGTTLPRVNFTPDYNSPDGRFQISYTGQERVLDNNITSNGEWVIKGYSGDIPVGIGSFNLRPRDAISDFIEYQAEEMSNANAPEHEVVAVNELSGDYGSSGAQYTDLAYAGIRLNSGVEWSSFNELSAYFKEGIKVFPSPFMGDPNNTDSFKPTNLLPEIAYDLLSNTDYGVGDSVGGDQVDKDEMAVAANFCNANGFYWDGVIGERVNIREWIYENAGYCLLQFRIKGGRFSLYPDVPFDGAGLIVKTQKISPKVLFTDGNMKDLQVSFLSPEERQLFKATVLWRQETTNGFPQTRTVTVHLSRGQGGSASDPEETFDMAGFCTSQEHAETFAKYALKTRQLVDHGIKFQTTPQMAMGLEPGEYFQVASAVTHSDTNLGSRLNNGSIDGEGNVIGLSIDNGTYDVQYWKPGTSGLNTARLQVANGKTSSSTLRNSIFAVSRQNNPQTRVYKLESLTYAEDGLVEVAGSVAPLTGSGSLATLEWGSDDDHFVVRAS